MKMSSKSDIQRAELDLESDKKAYQQALEAYHPFPSDRLRWVYSSFGKLHDFFKKYNGHIF